jgi:hypothetical protein
VLKPLQERQRLLWRLMRMTKKCEEWLREQRM